MTLWVLCVFKSNKHTRFEWLPIDVRCQSIGLELWKIAFHLKRCINRQRKTTAFFSPLYLSLSHYRYVCVCLFVPSWFSDNRSKTMSTFSHLYVNPILPIKWLFSITCGFFHFSFSVTHSLCVSALAVCLFLVMFRSSMQRLNWSYSLSTAVWKSQSLFTVANGNPLRTEVHPIIQPQKPILWDFSSRFLFLYIHIKNKRVYKSRKQYRQNRIEKKTTSNRRIYGSR